MTRRRGFVIHVVIAVLAIVASILLLFRATQRVRDAEVRLSADEVVARCLARGAVETLTYFAEKDLDRPLQEPSLALSQGRLHDAILDHGPRFERLFLRASEDSDQRDLLERLLGPEAFGRIREMAADSAGARLTYRVDAKVEGAGDYSVRDPVPKWIELGFTVRCRFRHADQTFRGDVGIAVYSVLPHALSRLALVWPAATAQRMNLPNVPPIVVFNRPEDYAADDPLLAGSTASVKAFPQTTAPGGGVYLSTGTGPLVMRLAAGDGAAGQAPLLYPGRDPAKGKATPLPAQPKLMKAFRSGTAPELQRAWAQGEVFGYEGTPIRELGAPGEGEDDGFASAFLRPLGTAAHPSPGEIYGDVYAGVAAIASLAIDRDDTDADERAQAAAGHPSPEREAADPFFMQATREEWDADLAREKSGQPYARLNPFGSPDLPPGQVHNLNATSPTEAGRDPLGLDLGHYRYANLFASYAEYGRAMSHRARVPYNAVARAAREKADGFLFQQAFGADPASTAGDLSTEAHWVHTDPLHAALADAVGNMDHVDTRGNAHWPLKKLVQDFPAFPRFTQHAIECKGEELFRSSFIEGSKLDLLNCTVQLAPAVDGDPPPAIDLGDVHVGPAGGGVLVAHQVTLSSLVNDGQGGAFSPLVIVTDKLILKGAGPYEGVFLTGAIETQPTGTHTLVRGMIYANTSFAFDGLTRPLAAVWEPRMDATGPEAHRLYRGLIMYGAGPRITGAGGKLVDASEYRRPPTRVVDARGRERQPPAWVVVRH